MLSVINRSIHGLAFETSCSTDCTNRSCSNLTSISTKVISLGHKVVHATILDGLNCISEVWKLYIDILLLLWRNLNIRIGSGTPRLLCSRLDSELV